MLDESPLDLSVIIVSWNVQALLRGCLRSLYNSPGVSFAGKGARQDYIAEVIVVDNASVDGSAEMVRDEFPSAVLLANATNRGFTAANNQGLALSRGRHVLFLNPDTEVLGDALAAMIGAMDDHPDIGGLGPELRYADGSRQLSRRRFPSLADAFFESTPIAWHWPGNPWARRYRMEDRPPVSGLAEPVDWVVGAALMARRVTLDQVGGFDEGYFMYSEELDWCRRARDAGWQIVFLPTAHIVHHEGKSSEQVVAARHIRFQTSKVRYFRKFHGPFAAETLRLMLLGSFAGEWLLEGGKWLLGSKKGLREQRMAAYGALLRSGLLPDRDRP